MVATLQRKLTVTPQLPTQVTNSKESDSSNAKQKNCRFYMKGSCKYGMKGNGCPFNHPKMCKKLLLHGTRNPKGCNKGKKCQDFHPKMCSSSIAKSCCHNKDCNLKHVKGTKRVKPSEPSTDSSFLDSVHLLKEEILKVMDLKFSHMMDQFQTNLQLHHPTKPPIPFHPKNTLYKHIPTQNHKTKHNSEILPLMQTYIPPPKSLQLQTHYQIHQPNQPYQRTTHQ